MGGWQHDRTTKGSRSGMVKDKYSMSFTTGSLFLLESVRLASLYLELGEWDSVREKVVSKNLLQSRTLNTLRRVCSEIVSRLRTLSPKELNFLVEGSPQEQGYLLWVAVCRRYRFIADFAVEVLRERYITLKGDLAQEEFDAFFNRKMEWHAEIEEVRSSTRNKLRQVLFKMLREADLLTSKNRINPAMLSGALMELLSRENPRDILFFPAFESDLKGMRP